MIFVISAGASAGLGLWLLTRVFRVQRISLQWRWNEYRRSGKKDEAEPPPISTIYPGQEHQQQEEGASAGAAKAFAAKTASSRVMGKGLMKIEEDLSLLEISSENHMIRKFASAILFGALAVILSFAAVVAGIFGTGWWQLALPAVFVAAGFIYPDRQVQSLAEEKREGLRKALAAYLDLVKILLAGGSHTDGALFQAASVGQGWGFSQLRAAVDWSRIQGQPTVAGFQRLAERTGVVEIAELSSILSLADAEGASLKDTLAHKAEMAAALDLAQARAKANAISEKMSLPAVVIAMSFVAFLAYPALKSILEAT